MFVATWNVLADVHTGEGQYGHVDPDLLKTGARTGLVVQTILELGADMIALQEVDPHLAAALEATGRWTTRFMQKVTGPAEGCMLLLPADAVGVYHRQYVYRDGTGHMAQAAVMNGVTFVNTHIKWTNVDGHNPVGMQQVRELIEWVSGAERVVLLGDFNSMPGEEVRAYVQDAGYCILLDERPTAFVNGWPIAVDLIAARGVTGQQVLKTFLADDIPNDDCASDHIPLVVKIDI